MLSLCVCSRPQEHRVSTNGVGMKTETPSTDNVSIDSAYILDTRTKTCLRNVCAESWESSEGKCTLVHQNSSNPKKGPYPLFLLFENIHRTYPFFLWKQQFCCKGVKQNKTKNNISRKMNWYNLALQQSQCFHLPQAQKQYNFWPSLS